MTMAQTPKRLLLVVAHPDDETFGCGSILLAAAEAGMATHVLCATRGEAGEATVETPAGDLASVRQAETLAAAAILGVASVRFLDFGDSGMSGPADPTTLVGADLPDVAARVVAAIDDLQPTIVVTLDASDGHRDHARIREATLVAVDTARHAVELVYLHCLPQELMRRWFDHMAINDPSWEHLSGDVPGTPEHDVTTVLDSAPFLERREAAMALHRSQRSPYDGLPDDLRRAFLTTEHLQRVRPIWDGGPIETSLTSIADNHSHNHH